MSVKKKIPFIGLIGIGLTTVIGSGIWKDSLLWANDVGILSMITISIGWVLFLCAGLSYSEVVSMFPKSGGPYSYVSGAFNKKAGSYMGILFLVGYLVVGTILCLLASLFTLAAINGALIGPLNVTLLTVAYLIVLTLLAGLSNPELFSIVSFGWVAAKVVLVLVVVILALINWNYTPPTNLTFGNYNVAINAGLWSLLGFEVMLVFSGEVDDVERKMPRGILIVLPIILVVYLVMAFTSSGLITLQEIPAGSGSLDVIGILATKIGVPPALIFAFAAFSAAGTGYAMISTCLQQIKVLADDDVIPKFFKYEKDGFRLAAVGIAALFTTVIGVILSVTMFYWDYAIDAFAAAGTGLILISAFLPAGAIALYLRIKFPAIKRPFKTPVFFLVFPLAILLSVYLLVINFISIQTVWPGLVIMIAIMAVVIGLVFLFDQINAGNIGKKAKTAAATTDAVEES